MQRRIPVLALLAVLAAPAVASAARPGELAMRIDEVRELQLDHELATVDADVSRTFRIVATTVALASLAALGLLLAPLAPGRRRRGQRRRMLRGGALAALLIILVVDVFAALVLVVGGTQSLFGRASNPSVALTAATLDVVARRGDRMAPIAPRFHRPTLEVPSGPRAEPLVSTMLRNLDEPVGDVAVFATLATAFDRLAWLLARLPLVLIALAGLVFLRTAGPLIASLARLPWRAAASGDRTDERRIVADAVAAVRAEVLATLCTTGVLATLTLTAALSLAVVLAPALDLILAYVHVSVLYVRLADHAAWSWISFGLTASVAFLVLHLAIVIVTTHALVARAHGSFRRRFHQGEPLAEHARLWTWGVAGTLWAQALPSLYLVAAVPAIRWLVDRSLAKFVVGRAVDEQNWAFVLTSGTTLFLISFVLVFWLLRGIKAIGFLYGYGAEQRPSRYPSLMAKVASAADGIQPVAPPTTTRQ